MFVEDSGLVVGQWYSNERKAESGKFAISSNDGSWSVGLIGDNGGGDELWI